MYSHKNLLTIQPFANLRPSPFVPYTGRELQTAFQQQSPVPAAVTSYWAVR